MKNINDHRADDGLTLGVLLVRRAVLQREVHRVVLRVKEASGLAQKMPVDPCIPAGVQLQKAGAGPISGPTRRLSHFSDAHPDVIHVARAREEHVATLGAVLVDRDLPRAKHRRTGPLSALPMTLVMRGACCCVRVELLSYHHRRWSSPAPFCQQYGVCCFLITRYQRETGHNGERWGRRHAPGGPGRSCSGRRARTPPRRRRLPEPPTAGFTG